MLERGGNEMMMSDQQYNELRKAYTMEDFEEVRE